MTPAQDVTLQVSFRRRYVETLGTVPALRTECDGDLGEWVAGVATAQAVETQIAGRKTFQD